LPEAEIDAQRQRGDEFGQTNTLSLVGRSHG
jgi:hypothetical protein